MSQPKSRANQLPRIAPTTSSPAAIRRSGLLQPPAGRGEAATGGRGLRARPPPRLPRPSRRPVPVAGCFSGSFGRGGLSRSGISTPPVNPGTLSPTERCCSPPATSRAGSHCAEFLGAREVRRGGRRRSGASVGGGSGLGGVRGRGTTRRRLFGPSPSCGSSVPLHGHGARAVVLRGAGAVPPAAATTSSGLPSRARMRRTAAGLSTVVFGPPPVDLAPQLRHQAHARGRRQLTLLSHVADAAQILVDDLVALDPHEVPSGAGVLDTVALIIK